MPDSSNLTTAEGRADFIRAQTTLRTVPHVLDRPAPVVSRYDVVLVGDLFYEQSTAERALAFLDRHVGVGSQVMIGDPGRAYLPTDRLTKLCEYQVPVTRDLEDFDIKRT